MSKMLHLAMLALVMFPLHASCQPPTKAQGPVVDVAGGVQKPGRYDWFKGMTVLDAIRSAGGLLDPSALTVRVAITHADHTQVVYRFSPETDPAKKQPALRDGDTVYVAQNLKISPITPIAPQPAK
jgi:protein involved in polysaccharide export with SLBB domain